MSGYGSVEFSCSYVLTIADSMLSNWRCQSTPHRETTPTTLCNCEHRTFLVVVKLTPWQNCKPHHDVTTPRHEHAPWPSRFHAHIDTPSTALSVPTPHFIVKSLYHLCFISISLPIVSIPPTFLSLRPYCPLFMPCRFTNTSHPTLLQYRLSTNT